MEVRTPTNREPSFTTRTNREASYTTRTNREPPAYMQTTNRDPIYMLIRENAKANLAIKVKFPLYKVWWQYAILFAIIFLLFNSYIHTSFNHSQTFAEVHLHIFTTVGSVGGTSMGLPSRDSKSGLPYSKPAHYTN